MRVLIPTHFPLTGSGSGVYVDNVARQLVRAGHDVLVVVPDHEAVPDREFACRTLLFSNGSRSHTDLPFDFPCFTTHPRSANTFYALTPHEIDEYVDAFRHAIGSAVQEFAPDLIHAQHLWVTAFCASELHLPYVVTSHGTDLIGFDRDARYHDMVHAGAQSASRIIAISRQVAQSIGERIDVAESKIVTIGNGFDPAVFHPDRSGDDMLLRELKIPTDAGPLLTFVGKLTHFKGADVLIQAAGTYEQEFPAAATLIVGDGESRSRLEQLSKSGPARGVVFLGHRPQKQVAALLRAADLHVMPSRGEPFGIAALEALACGTPVVGTNAGGLPDFISDEVGALVPVDDPDALAQAIVREIAAGSKGTKGPAAARYALENFTWELQVAKLITVYEEAVAAGRSAGG